MIDNIGNAFSFFFQVLSRVACLIFKCKSSTLKTVPLAGSFYLLAWLSNYFFPLVCFLRNMLYMECVIIEMMLREFRLLLRIITRG